MSYRCVTFCAAVPAGCRLLAYASGQSVLGAQKLARIGAGASGTANLAVRIGTSLTYHCTRSGSQRILKVLNVARFRFGTFTLIDEWTLGSPKLLPSVRKSSHVVASTGSLDPGEALICFDKNSKSISSASGGDRLVSAV